MSGGAKRQCDRTLVGGRTAAEAAETGERLAEAQLSAPELNIRMAQLLELISHQVPERARHRPKWLQCNEAQNLTCGCLPQSPSGAGLGEAAQHCAEALQLAEDGTLTKWRALFLQVGQQHVNRAALA